MNIETFKEEINIKIDEFINFWIENNKTNPEEFPLNLPDDGDDNFYEQFIAWTEL